MLRLFTRSIVCGTSLVCAGGLPSLAQSAIARLSGQVTDPDGNAIPGASIHVLNLDSLVTREAKTDGLGAYLVPSLPPGRYQIVVEVDGFDRRSSDVITLVAGQNFVFDARMTVSGVQTQVEVTGSAPAAAVETDTASLSTTLGQQEVTGVWLKRTQLCTTHHHGPLA